MLMRRNVAAGIGSDEQGEYCRAALRRFNRKEPRYKWPTFYFYFIEDNGCQHIRVTTSTCQVDVTFPVT